MLWYGINQWDFTNYIFSVSDKGKSNGSYHSLEDGKKSKDFNDKFRNVSRYQPNFVDANNGGVNGFVDVFLRHILLSQENR